MQPVFLCSKVGRLLTYSQRFIEAVFLLLLVRKNKKAQAKKDTRGRALRTGESQRKDGRYVYTYTDPLGRRKFVYDMDLQRLRDKERALVKDQLDGLDIYAAGRATDNDTFDRYISTKYDLR